MSRTPQEQLVHFVSDMYSVEQQALAQLVHAPDLAGDPALAGAFRQHYAETEQHAALMHDRLEALGGSASAIKQAIMKLGGKGFAAFAGVQPETPGRLVAHAYAYEAMEWAGYEVLIRFARHAGDTQTAELAVKIRDEERLMMDRLEQGFDAAQQASDRDTPPEKMGDDLRKHIGEAHAIESQAIQFLKRADDIAGDPELAQICSRHLEESRRHAQLLEQRLEALGTSPSTLKDAVLAAGGLQWSFFFQAQSDTPAKLAAFAYAFEHLEAAGYELLRRTARQAGDAETERLCETILAEEHAMARRLAGAFDSAVEATLAAVRS